MRTWTTFDHIAAPVEEVWDVLVNLHVGGRKRKKNARSITITPPGPLATGTKVEMGREGKTLLTVNECVPPSILSLSVASGTTTGESRFVLHRAGHHTYVEHTLSVELKGLRRLFAFVMARSLKQELHALRYKVEKLPRANVTAHDAQNPPPIST